MQRVHDSTSNQWERIMLLVVRLESILVKHRMDMKISGAVFPSSSFNASRIDSTPKPIFPTFIFVSSCNRAHLKRSITGQTFVGSQVRAFFITASGRCYISIHGSEMCFSAATKSCKTVTSFSFKALLLFSA